MSAGRCPNAFAWMAPINASLSNAQIASFESRDHLVYLISDLPKDRNMGHLPAMVPAVKGLLAACKAIDPTLA